MAESVGAVPLKYPMVTPPAEGTVEAEVVIWPLLLKDSACEIVFTALDELIDPTRSVKLKTAPIREV